MIPLASFGNAVGTFTAQNIGAKKIDRVKEGQSSDAINFALKYIQIVSAFYIIKGFMNAYRGVLKGAGDIGVFVWSTILNFLARLIIVYAFANVIGAPIIYYGVPIGWFIGLAIGYIRYKS